MKLNNYIKEEFITYKHKLNKVYSIYEKPTKSELRALIKEEELMPFIVKKEKDFVKCFMFRFIADRTTKKIFVFNYNYLHEDAMNYLEKEKLVKDISYSNITRGILNYNLKDDIFETYNLTTNEWDFLGDYLDKLNNNKVIKEEFSDYVKNFNGNTAAVYINPTRDEIKSIIKEEKNIDDDKYYYFRFIAVEDTKDIFVFSSFNLHSMVSSQLVKSKKIKPESVIFFGVLKLRKKLNTFEIHDDEGYRKPSKNFDFVNDFIKKLNKGVIQEEFANYAKSRSNKTIEVLKNPSLKELLKEAKKDYFIDEGDWISFRIIVNLENKNIYIAVSNLLHDDIYSAIKEKDKISSKKNYLAGFANLDLVTKKFEITFLEQKEEYKIVTDKLYQPKYKFIQNYINKINGK